MNKLYDPDFGNPSATFFDHGEIWKMLKTELLPNMITNLSEGSIVRAWVIAASTGQLAYSLAMVFTEVLEELRPKDNIKLQIIATDLNINRLEFAKKGKYYLLPDLQKRISPERLNQFFDKKGSGHLYQVKNKIRSMVDFSAHNVLIDPPVTENNIVSCSHLEQWLTEEHRKILFQTIDSSLVQGGFFWHSYNAFYSEINMK